MRKVKFYLEDMRDNELVSNKIDKLIESGASLVDVKTSVVKTETGRPMTLFTVIYEEED